MKKSLNDKTRSFRIALSISLGLFLSLNGWSQEFYFGHDLSYVNQMEDCGALFRERGAPKDVYQIFADHGTNLVRVRLWVDPSWWQGPLEQPEGVKPYYNDLEDVKETLSRAKEKGMKTMLGIHYSDFWADPGRQLIPRRWLDVAYSLENLKDSVYNYTYNLMTELESEGLMPDFVKVGNENNGGILKHIPIVNGWEPAETVSNSWARHAQLFNAGIAAVREVGATASVNPKIVIHFSNKLSGQVWNFRNIMNNGVTDFDVIGISYYYAWHGGSITELRTTIADLVDAFPGYDVMVAETGYLWTTKNFDGLGNIINTPDPQYLPVSPEKQLEYMVDFTRAVKSGGGNGVIFWEPAWVSTPCRTPWGVGSSQEHVAFFDPENLIFMENGGGMWCDTSFYGDPDTSSVTFKVKMEEGADLSRGVYIVGEISDWEITPLQAEGDLVFSKTFKLPVGNTVLAYYYMTTDTWDNYEDYRETVPAECALRWDSDRGIVVPPNDTIVGHNWGSCDTIGTPVGVFTESIDIGDENMIYPNPANMKFYIRLPHPEQKTSIRIFELSGREIWSELQEATGSDLLVDVGELANGLYLVSIQQDGERFFRKMIIGEGL